MKTKTILVVEDNELNMKLVKGLISIGKYRMLQAPDAESGIQLIREQRPDLVLMDIQLPGMDGLSATKILKEDPNLKDMPIVALTSYAMEGDKEKAMECLEQAVEMQLSRITAMSYDPVLDPLRNDPRYAKALERMGLMESL